MSSDLLPFILGGLAAGSAYGIAAMGFVLSYKTSGIFNFAHGAIAAIGAGVFYQLHVLWHWNGLLAVVVTVLGVGVVFGLLMERVAYVLSAATASMKVVGTVAIMVSLTAVFQLWFGFEQRGYPPFLPTGSIKIASLNIGADQAIIILVGVIAMVALVLLLRLGSFGRNTRAVVDDPALFELAGGRPTVVRRQGWVVGCVFAAISGVLIAPSLGLDATALTLLVLQSFGAAAIGRFRSVPLAFAGALVLGIAGSVATKYAVANPALNALPTSLPFVILFLVLIFTRRGGLVNLGALQEKQPLGALPATLRTRTAKFVVAVVLMAVVPFVVGTELSAWMQGLVYVILLLSLSLIVRTANQVSLCHMSFAGIGAIAFYHLLDTGVPWFLALLIAGLAVIPVGAFIAIPAVRLPGVYLALATLGFGILLEQQVFTLDWMFGSGGTSRFVDRPGFATDNIVYYFVILAVALLAYALVQWAERGQLGRLLRARADAPLALSSLGGSVRTPAVLVFCLSAFVAGIAGALLGPVFEVVGPTSFQTVPNSLMLVALLVLASRSKRIGSLGVAMGGAIGLAVLPAYLPNAQTQAWLTLLFGVAAVEAAIHSRDDRERAPAPGPSRWLTRRIWKPAVNAAPVTEADASGPDIANEPVVASTRSGRDVRN